MNIFVTAEPFEIESSIDISSISVIEIESGTYYPVVGADDYMVKDNGDFYNSESYIVVGEMNGYISWDLGIRFPSVSILSGKTIISAFIRFTEFLSGSGSGTVCNANCYFNDIDNAIAPLNATAYHALAITSLLAWDSIEPWISGNQYDTPELKTILQEVIDRVGWSSGNAVQFLLKDNGSSINARRIPSSVLYLSGAEKAELHIEWASGITTNIINVPSFEIESFIDSPSVFNGTGVITESFELESSIESPSIVRGRFITVENFNSSSELENSVIRNRIFVQEFNITSALDNPTVIKGRAITVQGFSSILELENPVIKRGIIAEAFEVVSELAIPGVTGITIVSAEPFEVLGSIDNPVVIKGRTIQVEAFETISILENPNIKTALFLEEFNAISLITNPEVKIGRFVIAEEFNTSVELENLAISSGLSIFAQEFDIVSSLSVISILIGRVVIAEEFNVTSSMEASIKSIFGSSLSFLNSILMGESISFVNSLMITVEDYISLMNNILLSLRGSITFKMDIHELTQINGSLKIVNNILDENRGRTYGVFYFSKTHGL